MSAIKPNGHIVIRELSDQALIDAIEEGMAMGVNADRLVSLEVERARRAQQKHERRIPVQLELEEARA